MTKMIESVTHRVGAFTSCRARKTVIAFAAIAAFFTAFVMTTDQAEARATWSLQGSVSSVYGNSRAFGLPTKTKTKSYRAPSYKAKRKTRTKKKSRRLAKSKKKFFKKARKSKKSAKSYKVAALDNKTFDVKPSLPKKSLTGGSGVRWVASSSCLNPRLRAIVGEVAANYGHVTVNSTCRSKGHNRRVGGARRSQHLTGDAVDFRVRGNYRGAWAYLKTAMGVGGYKHYGGGLFHVDTGPRRTW